jgi:hypothetical protein
MQDIHYCSFPVKTFPLVVGYNTEKQIQTHGHMAHPMQIPPMEQLMIYNAVASGPSHAEEE